MLQQTRVETVVPYYERFLSRFPDVGALAAAPVDEVLELWAGLGYYRRARGLHLAAREVVERYGGRVPSEALELRTLPGVGAYTAGAIASIAFGRREPLVDGNVARVLSRVERLEADPKSASGSRRLWEIAARLVPAREPGAWNEALMELGATLCMPRDPQCEACPLRSLCRARLAGREAELPIVRAKKVSPIVHLVAAVVRHEGAVLLARRPEGGLFGGLWEPPMVEGASLSAARAGLRTAGVDLTRVPLTTSGRVRHVLSHRVLDVLVTGGAARTRFDVRDAPVSGYERTAWCSLDAPGVGMSTLARKVVELVEPASEPSFRRASLRRCRPPHE